MNTSKIATIVPYNHLELTRNDDYFMALSHAASYGGYQAFFKSMRRLGKYTILDNSAVETGAPEGFARYFEKACDMEVSEIMLPDIFRDAEATLQTAKDVLNEYGGRIHLHSFDVMVIPQGKTVAEWRDNAERLQGLALSAGMFPVIGISCRYTEMFGGNRVFGVIALQGLKNLRIHLLGCYANPLVEVAPLLAVPYVVGVDSSYPSVYAQHGLPLREEDFFNPRPERNIDFLKDTYDVELLRKNIEAWREACQSVM